ncbi:hypothetical protein B0A48_00683 [Cryoendolithus antarcticus]|uniref:Terpene cyclase/mutase family member n=1 Tax=Cryoendolithus antarcticus TaxID=1507870 RepID=A0A1V8TV75_9PEZI|nr:hypothetical protein B0A48_00683 [Cryoendolithus antarcticus]
MSLRRRGEAKQANGFASGRANGLANGRLRGQQEVLSPTDAKTDHSRWRLRDTNGVHTWHYLESDEQVAAWPQSAAELHYLGQDTGAPLLPKATTPLQAAENGIAFYERMQLPTGHWGAEYGGPMFLMPGYVITCYVTESRFSQAEETEMIRYLFSVQNLGAKNGGDGGWGLHVEADSSVFGTAMNYTTLRLLGVPAEDPRMRKARGCLYDLNGALLGPHWAKWWLSVLGVMEWDVVNPVPPELWLLPDWVPIAPYRWCYIWSKQWVYRKADSDPLIRQLRQELFTQSHDEIKWARYQNAISPADNYHPKTHLLDLLNLILVLIWIPFLRTATIVRKAEAFAWRLIQIEDANTDHGCLATVNAPMNTLACFIAEGPDSYSFKRHRQKLHEGMWMTGRGMLVCGTDGLQTWDTSFSIQSLTGSGLAHEPKYRPMLLNALKFLETQQFTEHCVGYETSSLYSDPPTAKVNAQFGYRQPRKGGWGFSGKGQGYIVSDCVSEALKSVLLLQTTTNPDDPSKRIFPEVMSFERLRWAVDIILSMQNETGGIASYEARRGSTKLEVLNAAEVFGRIMVEYDYPECTTSCVTAVQLFRQVYPDYRAEAIESFMTRAVDWIRKDQRDDGSWYGSWGICFTYAGFFALESLATQGETYENSERVQRACKFFLDRQNADGGWGESYKSCETGRWCDHPDGSQVVQTAWVVCAMLEAKFPQREPLERAVRLMMERQQENGEWLQEGIEGVFNKSCMISFPNYKFIFPIKALVMHKQANLQDDNSC